MKRLIALTVMVAMLCTLMPALASAPTPAAPTEPGAALIPDTYQWFVSLPGRDLPTSLARLRALFGLTTDPNALMQNVIDSVFPGYGLRFADDIAPWLGETVAVGFNDETDFVVLASTTNPGLSDRFLQKLALAMSGQGQFVAPVAYGNIIVYEGDTVALTGFRGYVAYGSPEGIRQVIAVALGKARALDRTAGMRQTFNGLPVDRLAAAYVGEQAIGTALSGLGFDFGSILGSNRITGIGMAASVPSGNPSAVQLDVSIGFAEPVPPPIPSTSSIGSAVERALPENVLGFAVAYDLRLPVRAGLYAFVLQSYVQRALDAAAAGQPAPQMPTQQQTESMANGLIAAASLALAQSGLNVNLQRDVLDWLSGEYAVGVLPNPAGLYGDPRLPFDFFAVAQALDRNATLNIIEVLSRTLSSQLGMTPVLVNVDGYDLRAVSDPSTRGNLFAFGLVGDFLVMATGDGIRQFTAVANRSTPALANNATWQQRARFIPAGSEAFLYLPAADFADYARTSLSGEMRDQIVPMLAPYASALVSVDVVEENSLIVLTAVIETR